MFSKVVKYVSGGHRDWFPYDVSCNLIRNADATQIHHDCSEDEDEWTFLLYLNPDWRVDDYGETVFYEKNDDDTEIITEVLPKYGRVVIFQGGNLFTKWASIIHQSIENLVFQGCH